MPGCSAQAITVPLAVWAAAAPHAQSLSCAGLATSTLAALDACKETRHGQRGLPNQQKQPLQDYADTSCITAERWRWRSKRPWC